MPGGWDQRFSFGTPLTTPPSQRPAGGDPARVLAALRQSGITLVIVNWDEADRLKRTYGLDREITRENIAALVTAGAKRVESLAPQMEILEVAGGR